MKFFKFFTSSVLVTFELRLVSVRSQVYSYYSVIIIHEFTIHMRFNNV